MPIPRAVSRRPEVPNLSDQVIQSLTQLCFRPPESSPADLIFNFSTPRGIDQVVELVNHLVTQNLATKLMSTGGIHHYQDDTFDQIPPTIESQLLIDSLPKSIKNKLTIYQEQTSQNFLQNVQEALKILDFSTYQTIIFITKAYASGRAYLTLRKYCPHSTLLAQTYCPIYQPENLVFNETGWWQHQTSRSLVWGEYLRIKLYGSRGQIEYTEIQPLVESIQTNTHD